MSDPNEVSCANCLFWERLPQFENQEIGECRVCPPAISSSVSNGGIWPYVMSDRWCGQFIWNDLALRGQYKDVIATFRAEWGLDRPDRREGEK